MPIAQRVDFPDVLRLTSVAGSTVKVTLTLAGGAAEAVNQVGFWDEKRGVVENGLTLKAGEEARVAFAFELPPDSAAGLLEGVLTVAATLEDGSSQQQELPFALSVVATDVVPDASASPQPASSPSAAAGGRPPLLQSLERLSLAADSSPASSTDRRHTEGCADPTPRAGGRSASGPFAVR